jgi:hypothetical protein
VRPSPTAGQASLEYVAALSLVAAVLVIAAPAVGAPSLASGVARAVRLGICVVAGDVCTRGEAAAAGLPPCELDSATRGYDARLTLFSIELGTKDVLTGVRFSDGSVSLAWSKSGSLGGSGGFGIESSLIDVGVDGGLRAKVTAMRGWRFADEATARRFAAGLPASAADERRWPAAWHTVEGGVDAEAGARASVRGLDLAELGIASEDLAGARIARDGTTTLYLAVSLDGPEGGVPGFPTVGRGKASAIEELTIGREGPRSVALRTVVPGARGSRLAETVYRLPLHGGSPPPPWEIAERARREGAVERNRYAYSDASRGASGAIALGIELGADVEVVDVRRTLVDATARTPGSARERSRFDCLDAMGSSSSG